ncbi:MAG: HAMP domain-containing histidine kinase [Holophagales bacterium]|nr:HAMP domain-containing histidine kinase [Holophagales bacterium]
MIRLRLIFGGVALLLAVPVALLVRHALDNVEADREARHEALAERLFDEMERELTVWLRQEEDRPYDHYRFLYFPAGAAEPLRSPLADGPDAPFVLAHFQIEPEGAVSSPLWPVDPDRAAEALGWRMAPGQEIRRDEILALLTDLVLRRAPPGTSADGSAAERVASGQGKGAPAVEDGVAGEGSGADLLSRRQLALARLRDVPAEDLLSRLNRGQQSRQGRTTKVQQSQVANVLDFTQAPALPEGLDDAEAFTGESAAGLVEVSLEPMVGRGLAGSGVLLYRTVVIGDRAYRQGMVIDGPSLVDWLQAQVLAPGLAERSAASRLGAESYGGLDSFDRRRPTEPAPGGVEVGWSAGTQGGPAEPVGEGLEEAVQTASAPSAGIPFGSERIAFRHRFAEPFSSVEARLEMDPLPTLPAALYIHFLAGLLGLVGTVGLLALYRTVAVRLAFAERRSNFVSAVTHELKTPLTAIRMYGEMLRDGVVPEEGRRHDYYRILTAEAERLTRLIDNVLELSRLEKQTHDFDLRCGDPREVLAEVAEILTPHAEEEGFELRIEDNGPANARFDRDALAQVVFNLVDNAIKYAGSAVDRTVLLSSIAGEGRVRLTVADRGPGIGREHLKMVFEPFYRGENELTRRAQGTGIGLSLVQGLVSQMGGTVRGRNRDGGGFEVTLELPAA